MMKHISILRTAVTAVLVAAAVTIGTVSFFTLTAYENNRCVQSFHNVAHYVVESLIDDFGQKKNATMVMAKNMAYSHANISQWPNVVVPGFYDTGLAQRKSAGLVDLFFMPFVRPEQLASFEAFMSEYFISEPTIGPGPHFFTGRGVYAFDANGQPYHDTTGIALRYDSPNALIAPLLQLLFSK